jgi:hypothetical protein
MVFLARFQRGFVWAFLAAPDLRLTLREVGYKPALAWIAI